MNGRERPVCLLKPGPLATSKATKQAMLRDWGSRDAEFKEMTATVRRKLLDLIGDAKGELECVPLQGSGTFAVEAMLGTLVGPDDKALALVGPSQQRYMTRHEVGFDRFRAQSVADQ